MPEVVTFNQSRKRKMNIMMHRVVTKSHWLEFAYLTVLDYRNYRAYEFHLRLA